MKKILALVLVAVLALLATGCGSSDKSSSSSTETTDTTAATTSSSGGGFKVGLNTDTGGLNDKGFNHLAYVGLQKAESELGVQTRVVQSKSTSDYIPNLSALARQGYDLVIGVGFAQGDAIGKVAQKFPNVGFAIIDVDQASLKHKPKNVLGLLFREQDVGYLAGYLAALEEKRRPGADVIGSVGGQRQPPVDRFIAGYQAGARRADPMIKTLNGYSQDFVAQDKCKEFALKHFDAGSSVEFQVAGGCGLGVLDAAKEQNKWGIGVDVDQKSTAPKNILTSAQKKVDVGVYDTIKDVVDGKFKGGQDRLFALKDGGVGLAAISGKVSASIRAAEKKTEAAILSGKLKPPVK